MTVPTTPPTDNLPALVRRLREYADSGDSPISVSACMHSAADALEKNDRALKAIAEINNGPDRASGEYRAQFAVTIARQALGGSDE